MKLRVLNIIFGMFMAACIATSCLDNDVVEYEYSSNASITGFSIVDSIVTQYETVIDGKDTTLSTAVIGTDYPFVIDQNEGLIYNMDSLPMGTDISKVVVNITADTYGIYIVAESDSLWEEGDSLNFENPIYFKVIAETGVFGRRYKAQINVHQQDPDVLVWEKVENNINPNIQAQKAIYFNGSIYVFTEQGSQTAVTMTNDPKGKTWTALTEIDIPAKADYTSAMAWGKQLYILAEKKLYTSSNGINWDEVETETSISKLLSNVYTESTQKLFAISADNYYIESEDGINWVQHKTMPNEFPIKNISSVTYTLDTNSKIHRSVLIGENNIATDTTTIVWTKLNSEKEWIGLTFDNNTHACPKFKNSSLIHYNNKLYTFGGPGQYYEKLDAFDALYESNDNGISWQKSSEKEIFPEEFKNLYHKANGNYSCVIDENQFIWIIWSQSGEIWKGRINKLGFNK